MSDAANRPPAQRRELALNAARIRMRSSKDRTLLSTEAIDALCEDYLALHAETFCFHGVRFTDECAKCAEET